jgi:hypothetical protein
LPIFWDADTHSGRNIQRCVMLFDPKHERHLGGLEAQLRSARAPTSGLLLDVIAEACDSFPERETAAKLRVNRLIAAGAWTDAALALVELELPRWSLRRIVYDDGEWHCCLSRQPQLPLGLDEVAEASHEILSLAILVAFLEARRHAAASATAVTTVPRMGPTPGYAMCCDDFA